MHEGLPLSRSTTVGSIRIHGIEAGVQQLDGGAMFGVVPKPLWERRIPADTRNRIPLALRCLLVEAPNALVLVDTGVGKATIRSTGVKARVEVNLSTGREGHEHYRAYALHQSRLEKSPGRADGGDYS